MIRRVTSKELREIKVSNKVVAEIRKPSGGRVFVIEVEDGNDKCISNNTQHTVEDYNLKTTSV